jgi:hypothetical protein
MPIIDVYAAADLFAVGTDRVLAEELTGALLRAEGVSTPPPLHLDNTAAYVHRLPTRGVHTARTASARTVRVQVLTPPGVLNRTAQKRLGWGGYGDHRQDLRRPFANRAHVGAPDRGGGMRLGHCRNRIRPRRARGARESGEVMCGAALHGREAFGP